MSTKIKKQNKKVKAVTSTGKFQNIVKFPSSVLAPVGDFLRERLKTLETRKKELEKSDPFSDPSRTENNASPDTDAAEQFGHSRYEALKNQVDKKIIQTRKAMAQVKVGKYGICEDCGNMIDTERLIVYPEATFCAKCQKKRER